MDSSDPDLILDERGVCLYCHTTSIISQKRPKTPQEAIQRLETVAEKIRKDGHGRQYDCIIGISGGVDSAYTTHLAHQLKLRPLMVHLDNGWNSELAVANIKRIVDKCGFDLHTHVVNWPEFKDIQRSLLLASVLDVELVTDHSFFALLTDIARKNKIRYSLSGNNTATESFMPESWNWLKSDLRNLKAIQARFGTRPIKTLPTLNFWIRLAYERLGLICKPIYLLEDCIYRKSEALALLESEYGFRYYGGKHYESTFTKFYQAYILPRKFGIDKRRVHLSSLITNGEITRQQALVELDTPVYPESELRKEMSFVLRKLGFSKEEFEAIMASPPVPHDHYPSDIKIYRILRWLKLKLWGRG